MKPIRRNTATKERAEWREYVETCVREDPEEHILCPDEITTDLVLRLLDDADELERVHTALFDLVENPEWRDIGSMAPTQDVVYAATIADRFLDIDAPDYSERDDETYFYEPWYFDEEDGR